MSNVILTADESLVRWLLFESGVTRYRISKDTEIPDNSLSDLVTGKSKIEKMSFARAAKLTAYASEIKKSQE